MKIIKLNTKRAENQYEQFYSRVSGGIDLHKDNINKKYINTNNPSRVTEKEYIKAYMKLLSK